VRPFECIHDAVPKALSVAGQMTVGDVVQVEEVIHKVAHDAEVVRRAIIVAVGGEFASLQAAHLGHLLLGKVRGVGDYPFERVCRDGVAVVVVRGRERAMADEVREDEKGRFLDGRSRREREGTDEAGGRAGRSRRWRQSR
jgi:hypothetical protein